MRGPGSSLLTMMRIRGSCVAIDGDGVLIRGPSGAGKSDLALRLIEDGAVLVSDDYTQVTSRDGSLAASPPATIRGMLEVRGLGIMTMDVQAPVRLTAVVDLVQAREVSRLPEPDSVDVLGVALPRFRLAALEASAPAKVRLAVRIATRRIIPARLHCGSTS